VDTRLLTDAVNSGQNRPIPVAADDLEDRIGKERRSMKPTKTMPRTGTAEPKARREQAIEESSRGAKLMLQIEELEARLAPSRAGGSGVEVWK
jgi:hypothetical protein